MHVHQWFWSAQKLKSNLLAAYSAILISSSDLLKHESGSLPGCVFVHISGSDLVKHWRATHILGAYSAILNSHSDLIKDLRVTHFLYPCSVMFWSGQSLERDSQTRYGSATLISGS